MAVYVDAYRAKCGRMKMSHMIADTHEELQNMADAIGVQRRWIQSLGAGDERYYICESKRKLAIKNGAEELSTTAVVHKIRAKVRKMRAA